MAAAKRKLDHVTTLRELWKRVADQFWTVIVTEEFTQLSADLVHKLLSRNDLRVKSEWDIVWAVERWISADEPGRLRHAARLFGCVHFRNLSTKELYHLAHRQEPMFNEPQIRKAIVDANWYQTCLKEKNSVNIGKKTANSTGGAVGVDQSQRQSSSKQPHAAVR